MSVKDRSAILEMKKAVQKHHRTFGRHDLPWRKLQTPYRVFVSELMLQQTQVERVIPKFNAFIRRFPTFQKLSEASTAEVYKLWAGLGYNRRAKFLRDSARVVMEVYGGKLPKLKEELTLLSGVGPYTAGAILAFSYGNPEPFVETNIRTVVMHHVFARKQKVIDAEILQVLNQIKPKQGDSARNWYGALMDYGTHLKRCGVRTNSKSAHYAKQKAFKGSLREVRGALLKAIGSAALSEAKLLKLGFAKTSVQKALEGLQKDKLIEKSARGWKLTS